MVKVTWQSGLVFEAMPPSGCTLTFDTHPDSGGQGLGPTPVEALLSSIAACSAMDVISILQKKRQEVTAYRVEIEGDRVEPGTWPRPFTAIRLRHVITGRDIDPDAVARAVELSDDKYCSVIATLRTSPNVSSVWEIESEPAP
jgi:putative redox protein